MYDRNDPSLDEIDKMDWEQLLELRYEFSRRIMNLRRTYGKMEHGLKYKYATNLQFVEEALRKLGDRAPRKVALEVWQVGESVYKVRISANADGFFFEGQYRGSGFTSHVSFPKGRGIVFLVGDRDECVEFLKSELPKARCPENVLDSLVKSVENWSTEGVTGSGSEP